MNGLSQINIEITSHCDKKTVCFMCGHQQASVNPNLKYQHMDFDLLQAIALQIDPPVIVSLHRDGDPLAFPRLGDALLEGVAVLGEAIAEVAAE